MTFKDDLIDDIDTFLEPDEFAETVRFDDKEIVGSLEEVSSDEYQKKGGVDYAQPLFKRYYRLFARESDFAPNMPRTSDWVEVNGIRMSVIRCKPEFGILTIELGCNDS